MAASVSSERVGARFSLSGMIAARDHTFEAVRRIAAGIQSGMTEGEAHTLSDRVLADMEMDRLWHKTIIRFGEGTLDTFHALKDDDRVLRNDDIFFVDLGVVWKGHEGDAGDTFVVGADPEMLACAEAVRTIWKDVSNRWQEGRCTGEQLYEYARDNAERMGWRLNWEVKGHRVSDFPHAIYKAGDLGDLTSLPKAGLWILEIQIAHPTKAFGAFFEDLLVEEGGGPGL